MLINVNVKNNFAGFKSGCIFALLKKKQRKFIYIMRASL